MFDKVSTPLETVSAEEMYQDYVKELLKTNKQLTAKKFKYITNGAVYYAIPCPYCEGNGIVADRRKKKTKGTKVCYLCKGTKNAASDKLYITYPQFKEILASYNQLAGDKIVNGYTLDLGKSLGDLFIVRVERPQHGKKLDKYKSYQRRRELKALGTLTKTNWQVPYTDDDFIMVMWHKGNGLLRNIHLYKFKTAGGQPGKGFRFKVSNGIKVKPERKALYPYLPSKVLVPKSELAIVKTEKV